MSADQTEIPQINDPKEFAERLDASLLILRDEILRLEAGSQGVVTKDQLSAMLQHLFEIRDVVVQGRLPAIPERQSNSLGWIWRESWDWADPRGEFTYGVVSFYLRHLRIPSHFSDEAQNSDLVSTRVLSQKLVRQRGVAQQAKLTCPPVEHPDVLTMPHNPDKGSLDVMRDFARETVVKRADKIVAARAQRDARFFWDLCSQWLIIGLTDYWYKRPLPEVARSLRQGLTFAGEAITFGYPAHAWDIFHTFLKAEAVDDRRLAEQIMALAEGAWNRNQIKPVHWLILQIRCCFALHRDKDRELDPILADLHQAIFVDKLPSELERDLPVMHNFWRLLRAVRLRDAPDFNRQLAERAALLTTSFRQGGGIAPTALCDLHVLGLCRFAKQRGMPLTAQHVYLPFALLDQTT